MKITKQNLEAKEKRVNGLLRNIQLKISYRYNYTAIDITDKQGNIKTTLIAGLTKTEAYNILDCIEAVLTLEQKPI